MTINEKNWNSKELENHYLHLHKYYNNGLYNLKFGSYYSSFKSLNILRNNPEYDILEIGIGAGNFYRLLKINKINNKYTGADISEYYINLTKKIHNSNNFVLTSTDNSLNLEKKYDFVYSRMVAHHQTNPYDFINNLFNKTKSSLIIQLPTRDVGETNFDVNNSCQLVDGIWVPYIILNYQELKDFLLKKENIKNSKITFNREYTILGGKNLRYLEKALYYKNTKTATTTIVIEFNKKFEILETYENDLNFKKGLKYFYYLFLNKIKNKFKI
jgi:2-polyprenyl-3-methyl-5-hydroxy-6-metoxy-1,4-benzoquinol methylase